MTSTSKATFHDYITIWPGAASPATIRSMLTVTSLDHILYGSDYPYQPAEVLVGNLRLLEKALSEDKELSPYKEMFLWENAIRLFLGSR